MRTFINPVWTHGSQTSFGALVKTQVTPQPPIQWSRRGPRICISVKSQGRPTCWSRHHGENQGPTLSLSLPVSLSLSLMIVLRTRSVTEERLGQPFTGYHRPPSRAPGKAVAPPSRFCLHLLPPSTPRLCTHAHTPATFDLHPLAAWQDPPPGTQTPDVLETTQTPRHTQGVVLK